MSDTAKKPGQPAARKKYLSRSIAFIPENWERLQSEAKAEGRKIGPQLNRILQERYQPKPASDTKK